MQNILFISLFVVVFGGVIVWAIYNAIHRREISFEGVVLDKNMHENVNNNMRQPGLVIGNTSTVTHSYTIRVQPDSGKELTYGISSGMYETIKIGDRVSKPHGTTEITIVSSTPTAPVTPVAPVAPVAAVVQPVAPSVVPAPSATPAPPTPPVDPTTPANPT